MTTGEKIEDRLRKTIADELLKKLDREIKALCEAENGYCSAHNPTDAARALLADGPDVTGAELCDVIQFGPGRQSLLIMLEMALESTDCTCTELEIKERRAEEMGEATYEATK